jgi:hypothetical protein
MTLVEPRFAEKATLAGFSTRSCHAAFRERILVAHGGSRLSSALVERRWLFPLTGRLAYPIMSIDIIGVVCHSLQFPSHF